MTPSPIAKVLSTFRKHGVRSLLMGGQACILYGAAEFSRDVDIAVLASGENLKRLRRALDELRAEPVFVPPLETDTLVRGHAAHFRARVPEANGLRIDVMSVMHGCAPFEELWKRRSTFKLPGVGRVNVLALPDLVRAKKTQRDKDWPMVRRLIEASYHRHFKRPSRDLLLFWLRESRTASILIELCRKHPRAAARIAKERRAVAFALRAENDRVEDSLRQEEERLRALDKAYWKPLREELAVLWRKTRAKQ